MFYKKCKENNTLLFEVGLVYTCTYNYSLKSNSQKIILFNFPCQETLNNFGPINVLLAPTVCKEVQYDSDSTKQSYFYKGLVKTTVTCNARENIYNLPHNMQGKQKQYGIQQYVAGTLHY